MKTNSKNNVYFPARLPVTIVIACIGVMLLGLGGMALSVWRLIAFPVRDVWDTVKDILILPIGGFCAVTPLTVVLRSGYTITDKRLTQRFGIFRTQYDIRDISSMVLNSESKKLTVYFQGQAIVPMIAPDTNEAFSRAILTVKPDIDYGFTLADNPPDNPQE